MKISKILCAVLSVSMLGLTGCGKKGGIGTYKDANENFSYPVKTDVTLKYWCIDYNDGKINPDETPNAKYICERTGIKIETIPVSQSVAAEQFNLMLASGNIPDIVYYNWDSVPGGTQAAVKAGQILNLNEIIDKYMPNLKAKFSENPEWEKMAKNDEGDFCFVPAYRGDAQLLTYIGPIVRNDWLKDLGMDAPETLDDWEVMLKRFRDEKGAKSPFICNPSFLTMFMGGAYPVSMAGYSDDCYVKDGKIVYGCIQPEYKEALKVLARWYKEGLIDNNIASVDTETINSKMTSGKSGASISLTGGGMGKWLLNGRATYDKYDLIGVKYPVVNKNDVPKFGQMDNPMMTSVSTISANSKNPALAARYLDYFFSDEGINTVNYGKEGEAYDLVDGNKIFKKELIQNNTISEYACYAGGRGIQQWDAYKQSLAYENQVQAIENWKTADTKKYLIPSISLTTEESSEISKLVSDIKVYQSEMFYKFLFGTEDIETGFDKYVSQIESMGIDRVIKCKQAAYDRYNNR